MLQVDRVLHTTTTTMTTMMNRHCLVPLLLLFLAVCFSESFQISSNTRRRSSSLTTESAAIATPRTSVTPTVLYQSSPQAESVMTSDLPSSYVKCGRCETAYAVREEDLGRGKGRRLECSVCGHAWFQSKDRIMQIRDGFAFVSLPQSDRDRIASNIEQGRAPKFLGDVKLYVGNVAFECHEDDIKEIFSRVGDVGEVSLVRDDEGKNRGFGFVTMRTKDDGLKAIEALDGTSVRGRNIAVRESNN